MAVIRGTLAEVARHVEGRLVGLDTSFDAVTTDTRNLNEGQLFIALRGPNFDGNEFVRIAGEQGAAGALVDQVQTCDLAQVQVKDTRDALGRLAKAWRDQFGLPVLAVTGSNGKTTVKEMLTSILSGLGQTLATRGNLNNDIGVPLTLMRLGAEHEYAIVEMGANHAGEIAYLTGIARPSVGLVTNAAAAHLEGFGSIEGVAKAKGELFEHLEAGMTAIVNADDPHSGLWRSLAAHCQVLTFGISEYADIRVSEITQLVSGGDAQIKFRLETPSGSSFVGLSMAGRHNALNAAAAAAAAYAIGASPEVIAAGLANSEPVGGRLQILCGLSGCRLINDCYNANPTSLAAALQFVGGLTGEAWLVLGDMGELGHETEELHRVTGESARKAGVRRLFGFGPLSRHTVDEFGSGARHFDDIELLTNELSTALHKDVNLLVKGSRAMRLERLVKGLTVANGKPGYK